MRAGPSSVATESQETSPLNSKRRSRSAQLTWNSEEWRMSTGAAALGAKSAGGDIIRPNWTTSALNPPSCKTAAVCKLHSRVQQSCAWNFWWGNVWSASSCSSSWRTQTSAWHACLSVHTSDPARVCTSMLLWSCVLFVAQAWLFYVVECW